MTENKRFKVVKGQLYEYNNLLEAWHIVDIEKLCHVLNNIDELYYDFMQDMWLE